MTTTLEQPKDTFGLDDVSRLGDRVFGGLSKAAGVLILVTLFAVATFLLSEALPAFTNDTTELDGGVNLFDYIWPLIFGTVWAAALALLIATPMAVAVALFLSHYAPRPIATTLGYFVDLLAAIPSVVYGLWGIFVMAPLLGSNVYPWLADNASFIPLFAGPAAASGRSMMTVALVLAVMILPIITAIAREVFLQTPRLHEEASLALGATRWEMIRQAVLPYGRAGIISGAMLGLGRALGETMAVAIILSPTFGLISSNLISVSNPNTIASNIALEVSRIVGSRSQPSDRQRSGAFCHHLPGQLPRPSSCQRRILRSRRMTTTVAPQPHGLSKDSLSQGSLPRGATLSIGAVAVAIASLMAVVMGGFHPVKAGIIAAPVFLGTLYGTAASVEGSRRAKDRVVTASVTGAFVLVMIPLVSLFWTVITRGTARMDVAFFTETMRNVVGEGGGIRHALIGTLTVTGLATLFSVPFGLFTAIFLVEYGNGSRLSRTITMMVDVMTGIPSIVAGLFAYALFVVFQGSGTRSGLAGAIALTVLMTPVVVRSSEEMLRLVQDELREASLALGVPKWKTIFKVVLPTSIGGILTGVTLAIARVIGETAPLLVTAGLAQDTNWNPVDGRMTTLPVQAYYSYATPTLPPELSLERAWGAALVLIIVVAILFSFARLIATVLKPKGLR